MTYSQAIEAAIHRNKKTGCVVHVNARIIPAHTLPNQHQPELDEYGYYLSDWYDGSTVYSLS